MLEKVDVIEGIKNYLDMKGWGYKYDEKHNVFRFGMNIKCKLQHLQILIVVEDNNFNVYSICPMRARESEKMVIMKYLTMATCGLNAGNFEMDFRDGEIRYKMHASTRGMQELPVEIIQEAIIIPIVMFDKYGDGLATLLMGFSDPETEIAKVRED